MVLRFFQDKDWFSKSCPGKAARSVFLPSDDHELRIVDNAGYAGKCRELHCRPSTGTIRVVEESATRGVVDDAMIQGSSNGARATGEGANR